MALCRYCGRYNDITEWPGDFQEAYVQHCCFKCFEEDPSRLNIEEQKDKAEEAESLGGDESDASDDGFDDADEPEEADPTDGDDSDD